MKIWTLSDLHLFGDLETFGDRIRPPEADLCIVAGDLTDDIESSIRWLGRVVRPYMAVIYVLGNHDFFGRTVAQTKDAARRLADELDIALLDDDVETGGGVRFVGGTLWTDFEFHHDHTQGNLEITRRRRAREMAMEYANDNMPEYRHSWFDNGTTLRHLAAQDTLVMHRTTKAFFEETLFKPFGGPTVVVSHHAPHPGSAKDGYEGGRLNPAFVSDLSDIIGRYRPALWIHGHTHSSFDYRVGGTRIVCNPRGNGKGNPAFDWRKVVEVTA